MKRWCGTFRCRGRRSPPRSHRPCAPCFWRGWLRASHRGPMASRSSRPRAWWRAERRRIWLMLKQSLNGRRQPLAAFTTPWGQRTRQPLARFAVLAAVVACAPSTAPVTAPGPATAARVLQSPSSVWGFTAPWDPRSDSSVIANGPRLDAVITGWIQLDSASGEPSLLYPDDAKRPGSPRQRFALVTSWHGRRFHPVMVRRVAGDSAALS